VAAQVTEQAPAYPRIDFLVSLAAVVPPLAASVAPQASRVRGVAKRFAVLAAARNSQHALQS